MGDRHVPTSYARSSDFLALCLALSDSSIDPACGRRAACWAARVASSGVEHELIEASSDCDFVMLQAEPDLCAEVGTSLRRSEREASSLSPTRSRWTRKLCWLAAGRPVVELKQADHAECSRRAQSPVRVRARYPSSRPNVCATR